MNDFLKTLIKLVGLCAFSIVAFLTFTKLSVTTSENKDTNAKKHDAIIKISSREGSCSAFVVSDTKAITAGHCIFFSKSDIKKRNALVHELRVDLRKINKKILQARCNKLRRNSEDREVCEFIVADLLRNKSTILKEIKRLNKLIPDVFSVTTTEGVRTKILASAEDRHLSYRDYGVVTGDFKKFNKIVIKKNFNVLPGQVLSSCGFAEAKLPSICTTFVAHGNLGFQYMGRGYLVKGMSGGPVLDSDGEAVGINTMVVDNFVVMTPTIGVIENL
jgi:hypothetical protein